MSNTKKYIVKIEIPDHLGIVDKNDLSQKLKYAFEPFSDLSKIVDNDDLKVEEVKNFDKKELLALDKAQMIHWANDAIEAFDLNDRFGEDIDARHAAEEGAVAELNSLIHYVGSNTSDTTTERKLGAQALLFFCFNFRRNWIEQCYVDSPIRTHIRTKWDDMIVKYNKEHSGAASLKPGWVLRFVSELDTARLKDLINYAIDTHCSPD